MFEFWVHGMRARSIEQVKGYVFDTDPHVRSKVQVFVSGDIANQPWRGGRFYDVFEDWNDPTAGFPKKTPALVRNFVNKNLGDIHV